MTKSKQRKQSIFNLAGQSLIEIAETAHGAEDASKVFSLLGHGLHVLTSKVQDSDPQADPRLNDQIATAVLDIG